MAKRMVLVPEEVVDRFERKQRLETSPIMSDMMYKDAEMSNILRSAYLDNAEKQKLYNANLERYLELRRQKDEHIPSVRLAPIKEPAPPQLPAAPAVLPNGVPPAQQRLLDAQNLELPLDPLPDDAVVQPLPKTMRSRATALLERLKTRPDIISWDELGQVSLDGQKIPDSNIADLVSDAMRPRKSFNPTGSKRFFRVLSRLNIPKDLARNEERWQQSKVEGTPTSEDVSTPTQRGTPSKYFRDILKRRAGKHWLNY